MDRESAEWFQLWLRYDDGWEERALKARGTGYPEGYESFRDELLGWVQTVLVPEQ